MYQVELYGLKRDMVIWKAALSALGSVMGYSDDQLLAAAAHVLQTQSLQGGLPAHGSSRSTAPSTPKPTAGVRPSASDSPGSKGNSDAGMETACAVHETFELGVVHQSPCALPSPSTAKWSMSGPPGCAEHTKQADPTHVPSSATGPVMLAMPAARKRRLTTPSVSDAKGDVPPGERRGKRQTATSQYKGVRKEKRGKWSATILFLEADKAKRTQMRLGVYNKELEAATAYAAAVYVVKAGKRVAGTVELSAPEKCMLQGCTLSAVRHLVKGRQWFRWTEWETALADCPEEDTGGDRDAHSESQDDDEDDVGASQVTPIAAAASSVGAGDEDVGSHGEGEAAPVRSKPVASVMGDTPGTAKDTGAKAPPAPGPNDPFVALPSGAAEPASGSWLAATLAEDNVVISRHELEEMKTAREESDCKIARLEAQLLAAQDPKRANKRQIDTILNWDKRKARLSNSAGGNAQVVDGLHYVALLAVKQAIQTFKPKYDAEVEAWVWGEHGLMLSSCGLEHLVPGCYARRAAEQEDNASGSNGSALGGGWASVRSGSGFYM
ncbi:unnamed protein product [Closterium sp. Naga37s-1]|nr:unnamed protein product [Closterium sp. Naga37s-1]